MAASFITPVSVEKPETYTLPLSDDPPVSPRVSRSPRGSIPHCAIPGRVCLDDKVDTFEYGKGTIRFEGFVNDRQGVFFGLELDEPNGKHNGTIDNRIYFKSEPKCGIFIRKYEMSDLIVAANVRRLEVNDYITLPNRGAGIIRFIGNTEFDKAIWYGLELKRRYGKNNGTINGVKYFQCTKNYGLFVRGVKLHSFLEYRDELIAERKQAMAKQQSPKSSPRGSPRGSPRLSPRGDQKKKPKKKRFAMLRRKQSPNDENKSPSASPRENNLSPRSPVSPRSVNENVATPPPNKWDELDLLSFSDLDDTFNSSSDAGLADYFDSL